ncbi:MAG: bifunctional phosphopantothenoylcysteine decarboxylase/phosphopantothenate--cysteine ligase CoaBC [Lachnospiraceae bacterium]|nr:bifunctional phosphopantothenoylcysteine decarboxylase/phosphopantothenate--cysteine ligase CoaBC [Lachnospiraceae bacterium]
MLKDKCIILGVTGSIAAYKIASLASRLKKDGADVHVIMTENATNFINPITFETLTGNKCLVDTFDRDFEFSVEHVSLGQAADVMLVAPATANVIAKMAHGIADDMLTTTVLSTTAPIIVSPAMNTRMYEKPVTQDNIARLREYGMTVIDPAEGYLACGDIGAGKMPEPEDLYDEICFAIGHERILAGKKVIVTAGPTREAVDPVRFLTNHSTGRMGYALAQAAAICGAEVTLVSGPVEIPVPAHVKVVDISSAADMYDAVSAEFDDADILIGAAAVADYRPADVSGEKIKKSDSDMSIKMERTTDILGTLAAKKDHRFICGFSMETENVLVNSRDKLLRKNFDMIVANDLREPGAGFGVPTNVVTIITEKDETHLPLLTKDEVAFEILERIAKAL